MGNALGPSSSVLPPSAEPRAADLQATLAALHALRKELETLWRYRRLLLQQLRAYMQLQLLVESSEAAMASPTSETDERQSLIKTFCCLRDRVGAVELTLSPPIIDYFVSLPTDVTAISTPTQAAAAAAWFSEQVAEFERRSESCANDIRSARRRLYVATTPLTALNSLTASDRLALEGLRLQVTERLEAMAVEMHKSTP